MRRFFKSLILTLGALYLLACLALFAFQRELMYFPTKGTPPPGSQGFFGIPVISLDTPDGETLEMWWSDPPSASAPTILYLHGNAGDISVRSRRFADFTAEGFGMALLSWRGFGNSTGSPSEAGLITDAQTAYDWLLAQGIAPDRIVVLGESLGTGPAIRLAAENEVGAVLLGAPYTATVDIAAEQYPLVPVRLLMRDQFRSRDHIARITAPIHIRHGTDDTVIPHAHGAALAALATAPVTFESVPGAGHEITIDAVTTQREIAFLRQTLGN
ncbi:MAG: alpha/beta hydrolase [Pseudomonadota bacterium]